MRSAARASIRRAIGVAAISVMALVLAGSAGDGGCGMFVKAAEELCAESGGSWQGGACQCPGENAFFRDGRGCDTSEALALLPAQYRAPVAKQLAFTGGNVDQLLTAISETKAEQRAGIGFLLANMPTRDLLELSSAFLVENVTLSYQVRAQAPWGASIPEPIFLSNVLPYANLNERRDNWRKDFYDRFYSVAVNAGSMAAAVKELNRVVFETFGVSYHATKRPKPDQSPYESIAAHYASCTGLSILISDALRAVGIPTRVTGTPRWVDDSGNHNWVEVWDTRWHHIDSAAPADYDQVWFNDLAAQADPADEMHRIYAASFEKTDTYYRLVWDLGITYVSAVDVTTQYKH